VLKAEFDGTRKYQSSAMAGNLIVYCQLFRATYCTSSSWYKSKQSVGIGIGMSGPFKDKYCLHCSFSCWVTQSPEPSPPSSCICNIFCTLALLFYHEDGGSKFLWNVINDIPDYAASYPRRYNLHSHHSKNLKPHIDGTCYHPFPLLKLWYVLGYDSEMHVVYMYVS
jgi:hypothetical protein